MSDFHSDGCTGFFNVWRGIDLSKCCEAHDFAWYSHPGDWWAFIDSNFALARCFAGVGAWELVVISFLAVSTIGALLFISRRRKKSDG